MIIALDSGKARRDARLTSKSEAPFSCPVCERGTLLKKGLLKIHHFAHEPGSYCRWGSGETDLHRKAKTEIYDALSRNPNVKDVFLEKSIGEPRPDVQFRDGINLIAVEVQLSCLSREEIVRRTKQYRDMGVAVIWLVPQKPPQHHRKFSPKAYEKFIHSLNYGRVYYWLEGEVVLSVHYGPYFLWKSQDYISNPRMQDEEYSEEEGGEGGSGYYYRSKRWRVAKWGSRERLSSFRVTRRPEWMGNNPSVSVPEAILLTSRQSPWWERKTNASV